VHPLVVLKILFAFNDDVKLEKDFHLFVIIVSAFVG